MGFNKLKCPNCGFTRKHKNDRRLKKNKFGSIWCSKCETLTKKDKLKQIEINEIMRKYGKDNSNICY